MTLYTRDVVDALTGQVIPNVPLTSRSVWDEHLQAIGRYKKFSLNRFNYDAMADILLPRAVGYAAGFLNAFFCGSVGAMYEGRELEDRGLVRNDDRGLQATLRTIGRDAGRTGSVGRAPDRSR